MTISETTAMAPGDSLACQSGAAERAGSSAAGLISPNRRTRTGAPATQEAIAALLVARRWAECKPLRQHRCWKTIELKAINDGCGNLYVDARGEIWSGHTRREARRVGLGLRQRMLGEDA